MAPRNWKWKDTNVEGHMLVQLAAQVDHLIGQYSRAFYVSKVEYILYPGWLLTCSTGANK